MITTARAGRIAALVLLAAAASGCASIRQAVKTPYSGPVMAIPSNCTDLTATIYFNRGSAVLTNEAKAVLKNAAAQADMCRFTAVDVYGLSDAVGAPAANIALSKKRAEVVTGSLAQLGFRTVTFKLVAAGSAGAVTAGGEAEPLRRQADVIFHAGPAT
jgi:outer membrane protein OmpA-like peptidoglycan-associated protein